MSDSFKNARSASPRLEGLEDRLVMASPGSVVPSLIADYYESALGRSASEGEVAAWAAWMSRGAGLTGVASGLVRSGEAMNLSVERAYEDVFGRSADSAGLAGWGAARAAGMSYGRLLYDLFGSAEFNLSTPDNASFAGHLYRGVLGREGSEAEVRSWAAVLDSGRSRADVIGGFVHSDEFYARQIDGLYWQCLGRSADAAGLQANLNLVRKGVMTLEDVEVNLLTSAEKLSASTSAERPGAPSKGSRFPQVTFVGLPASGHSPEGSEQTVTASVSQSPSGAPYVFAWQASRDGVVVASGSSQTFSFTPSDDGAYAVKVSVTDSKNRKGQATAGWTVDNVAPTGSISGPSSGTVGTSLTFSGSGDDVSAADKAAGLRYAWDFGDGAKATGASVSHAFSAAGTYAVKLTVTDKDGGSKEVTRSVVISKVGDPDDPLNKLVLNESNFTYVGSFAMPRSDGTWDTAYSTGGLTHRYVDGELHFLTTSHVYSGGVVYEVAYPGLGTDEAGDVPQARLVRAWGDVYDGHKWVGNDGGSSALHGGVLTYGLYFDQDLDRLYWSYGHWYNATNPDNPSFGYSVLDDTTGEAAGVGAWSLTDRPEKFSRGGVLEIPQWFADRYTDGKTLGVGFGGYFSIVNSASFGPSLAAVSDPDISTNPDRSALDNVPLIGYPSDAPDRAHRDPNYTSEYDGGDWNPQDGTGYWTWSDTIYGGATWIDTPEGQGVLFIAKIGQGRVWYEASDRNAETGTYQWFVYSPKDLADVATGVKEQWEIQPMYSWVDNGTLPADTQGYTGEGIRQVGGVTYDASTGRLYVLVNAVDSNGYEAWPRVYVYQVSA